MIIAGAPGYPDVPYWLRISGTNQAVTIDGQYLPMPKPTGVFAKPVKAKGKDRRAMSVVRIGETETTYKTLREAAADNKISRGNLSKLLSGKYGMITLGGYTWRRA